jgi:hypothetical protein
MANGNQVWMRACMKPNWGWDPVVVEKQAFAVARFQIQEFAVAVTYDFIRQTGFDGCQDADQPLFNAVRPGDLTGDVFLVGDA